MTITNLPQADTSTYSHLIDTDEVRPRFDALVEELAHAAYSVVRSVPSHEGRLLERGIAMLAGFNPDLVVLTPSSHFPTVNLPALIRAPSVGRKPFLPQHLRRLRKLSSWPSQHHRAEPPPRRNRSSPRPSSALRSALPGARAAR